MSPVYTPVIVHLAVVTVIGLAMLAMGALFGRKRKSQAKAEPYESGVLPKTEAQQRFSVKFYLVAILFIVFDLETTFLYPWAVIYKSLNWFGLIEMIVFIAILLVGYIYVVKRGALEWD